MNLNIPGYGNMDIKHVVFDYNGTIALDGNLIQGVKEEMKKYSDRMNFHVITADTFGFVQKEIKDIDCTLTIIPKKDQAQTKLEYILELGAKHTLAVGNGSNDRKMLKHAGIGIAVLQDEGLACSSLVAADLVVKDILDVFGFFRTKERMIATLRA